MTVKQARTSWRIATYAVIFLTFTHTAHAATLAVRGEIGGVVRNASVEIQTREAVDYVSLRDLARQLGVGFETVSGRVQLDLGGQTAWIHLDTADVDASTGPLVLSHAMLREGDEVLIAASDLQRLFSGAFGLSLNLERLEAAPDGSRQVQTTEVSGQEAVSGAVDAAAVAAGAKVAAVILDPGHGGADEGAVIPEGIPEKAIALAVAQKLKRSLEPLLGAKVMLTREDDASLTEAQRVLFSERLKGDVFVSIHAGAGLTGQAHGVAIFCHPAQPGMPQHAGSAASRRLAQAVQHAIATGTDTNVQPVREIPLRVLSRLGDTPAILVEVGYVTNGAEATLLAQDAYQQTLADAIAAGIAAYAQEQEVR